MGCQWLAAACWGALGAAAFSSGGDAGVRGGCRSIWRWLLICTGEDSEEHPIRHGGQRKGQRQSHWMLERSEGCKDAGDAAVVTLGDGGTLEVASQGRADVDDAHARLSSGRR